MTLGKGAGGRLVLPYMVHLSSRQRLPRVFRACWLAGGRAAVAPGSLRRGGIAPGRSPGGGTMDRITRLWKQPLARTASVVAILVTLLGSGALVVSRATHASAGTCRLNSAQSNIQHVIYIQFDNTHFTRDNPNVPSDLEQMPHLLNFLENNGVLLTNHHTPLISHTATDILTSLTGVYGDHM